MDTIERLAAALGWDYWSDMPMVAGDFVGPGHYTTSYMNPETNWTLAGRLIEEYGIGFFKMEIGGKWRTTYSGEHESLLASPAYDSPIIAIYEAVIAIKAGE
jgi:hypothetical protein